MKWQGFLCGLVKPNSVRNKRHEKPNDVQPKDRGILPSWYRDVADSQDGTTSRNTIGVPRCKDTSVDTLLEACSEEHAGGGLRFVRLSNLKRCFDTSAHPIAVLLVQPDPEDEEEMAQSQSGAGDGRDSSTLLEAKQGLLECWYANLAAVEFNSFGSLIEFKSRMQRQMMQQPALVLMFESLIRRFQEGSAGSVRQFLPSMAPKQKTSRPKATVPGATNSPDARNSSIQNIVMSNMSGNAIDADNSFMMLEVAVCLAELEDGSQAPALFLHYAPAFQQSRLALAAQLKRDNIALGHMPSLVTIFTLDGRVLHQNGKSMAYMGFLQGHPIPSCHIHDPKHSLRILFQLEPTMLDDMWDSLQDGNVWHGRVRMPMVVNLDHNAVKRSMHLYRPPNLQSSAVLPKITLDQVVRGAAMVRPCLVTHDEATEDEPQSLEDLLESGLVRTANDGQMPGGPSQPRAPRIATGRGSLTASPFQVDQHQEPRRKPSRRHSVTFGYTEHMIDMDKEFGSGSALPASVPSHRLDHETSKSILMVGVIPVVDDHQDPDLIGGTRRARPTGSLKHTRMRRFSHQAIYDADYNQTLKSALWPDLDKTNYSNDSKVSHHSSNNSLTRIQSQLLKTLRANASVDDGMFSKWRVSSSGFQASRSSSACMKESDSGNMTAADLILRDRRASKSFTLNNHRKIDRRISGAMKQNDLPAANRVMKMLSHKSKDESAPSITPKSSLPKSLFSENFSVTSRADTLQEDELWFDIEANQFEDPATGENVILLVQTDVTAAVRAEIKMQRVLNAEHALLEEVFPKHVLEIMALDKVKEGDPSLGGLSAVRHVETLARSHKAVTILFADIVTFTNMCQLLEPKRVMSFLNDLFTRFDDVVGKHGVYKVETIGDCYLVAGGLLTEDEDGCKTIDEEYVDPEHARKVFNFAVEMLNIASTMMLPTAPDKPVQLRVGIHSGPVVSGVVGNRMPRFCLFGDTVNTASRMESTSQPGRIHVSAAARDAIGSKPLGGTWQPTGGIPVKGKGIMETYLYQSNHEAPLITVAEPVQSHEHAALKQHKHQAPHRARSAYNMISPSRLGRETANLVQEGEALPIPRGPTSPRHPSSLSGTGEIQHVNSVEQDYTLVHNPSSSSLGSHRNTWGHKPLKVQDQTSERSSPDSITPTPPMLISLVSSSEASHGLGMAMESSDSMEHHEYSGNVHGESVSSLPPHLKYDDMLLAMSSAPARSRMSQWVANQQRTMMRKENLPSFEFDDPGSGSGALIARQPVWGPGLDGANAAAIQTQGGDFGGCWSRSPAASASAPSAPEAGWTRKRTADLNGEEDADDNCELTLPLALLSDVEAAPATPD